MRVLMLFVDGLGWAPPGPHNPVRPDVCPALCRLLTEHGGPIDAGLDTPGLPQSATGQTTLLTGVNAARAAGRHIEGFPPESLRAIVREYNVFSQLERRGLRTTFANAYFTDDVDAVRARRRPSVTTVAALAAHGTVRDTARLLAGEAVYQDLTRDALRARGYDGPLVSPETAAAHLLAIWRAHDFTLFEFFQTDRAGHSTDPASAPDVLRRFDAFLAPLEAVAREPGGLLILSSDHGNIEDLSTRLHTRNPVPFVALGHGAPALRAAVRRLEDVVPALMGLWE